MDNIAEKHLHIVSFDVPWPANYGGVIDVFFKVKALSEKGVKVHLHCFEYGRKKAKVLEDICFSVNYYKRDISKKHLFKNIPYIVSSRTSESLVACLLKDDYPILLEGLHTCNLLNERRLSSRKISVRTHNVEHDYYLNLAKAESALFKKYYFYNEAGKLKKYQKVLKKADHLIAISQKDADYFAESFKNVTFIPAFHPHKAVNIIPGKGNYVLYHGNLSVAENFNAVRFLVNEVFNDMPVPFKVAGLHPPSQLVHLLAELPNVELIANPTDEALYKLISEAQVNISVTFQATGLKLKLLNTLYNGRFSLVNDKMLSGSALDSLCVIANDAPALKKQLKRLMKQSFTEKAISLRKEKLAILYHNGQNVDKLIELVT
ncbi:MAG: glycosyltransferase family 1 protein [Bacteroidetes bacterium]|jgi:hypothetical protein|nr:glycosyltransferase family 1 protein [Bacteroidota bacterium]